MRVASLGYRTDLMLRGLGGSDVSDRGSHLVVRTPSNPAYWWGNFLLLRERPGPGEWPGWVREFAREFPEAPHVALGLDRPDGTVGDIDGAIDLGLDVLVDTVLTASALRAPAAADAEIRPLFGDADWEQAVQLRLALDEVRVTPAHAGYLRRKVAEHRRLAEAGHGVWFGAFVEGTMRCGAGLYTDGEGVARYQNVETHPGFRQRGLASSLVHQLGEWGLHRPDVRELVIVADPGYHAIRLYRALGFQDTEHQVQLQRPPFG
ncbi:GNAT family N-acetyltransferase [Kineosporia succinea]|uniref:GNAT superfamily N-acetyltransferase n=1 Tax=Kineosporia succinea TaxID=84632 RepID=A0ABT9P560_9ACTN|nr:GNAT family N-acetyltransferase [Kineosporia succinea]MDP9827808.1 GNAT superfamily N-acetyltransferase [Kineosporia succinea]